MVSENSPLLGAHEERQAANNVEHAQQAGDAQSNRHVKEDPGTFKQHIKQFRVLYCLGLFSFIIDVSFMMMIAPMARLSELALCRRHYLQFDPSLVDGNGNVPELLCKIKPVQESLANLTGLLTMLGLLPTIFASVPFGSLADKFGRKIICALAITGISLAFIWYFVVLQYYTILPFALVYTFPLFFLIGGGGNVIIALTSAMVVDLTTSSIRARVFLFLSTTIVAAGLVGPPLGSILLEKLGPGPAFLWSIPPRIVSILLLFVIPETKDIKKTDVNDTPTAGQEATSTSAILAPETPLMARLRTSIAHLRRDVLPIMKQKAVVLGMFSLVVNHFTLPVVGMVVQYISVRFLWKFAQASYAIAFVSAVQIVLLTTVLPTVDHYLKRKYGSPEMANLVLSRGSIVFLVGGMLIVGLASEPMALFFGLFVYTCGSGYSPALRAYMTSLVPAKDTALLFSIIGVFDSFGGLFGAPLLALTFSTGIEHGGLAIGLPFYSAAVIYALSGVSIWSLEPPSKPLEETDESDAEVSER